MGELDEQLVQYADRGNLEGVLEMLNMGPVSTIRTDYLFMWLLTEDTWMW